MATKTITIIILLLISIITISSTCRKSCIEKNYSFSINAKAYPDIDSIYIGDTIWIDLDEPTTLLDQNSNMIINYSGAQNFGTAIGFIELLGSSHSREAANDFSLKLVKGSSLSNPYVNLIREFKFEEIGSRYLFKLGIIARRSGIFRIGLSNAANVYRKGNFCDKVSFGLNFKETNQHLYYNEWNFGVVVPLPNGGYCFKVK